MIDDRVLQLVAVPVQAPLTIGWIVIGFPVDQMLAAGLRKLTGLQVYQRTLQLQQLGFSPTQIRNAGGGAWGAGWTAGPRRALARAVRTL